jgi:hypothetical protein
MLRQERIKGPLYIAHHTQPTPHRILSQHLLHTQLLYGM